jgi:hypothetical protein
LTFAGCSTYFLSAVAACRRGDELHLTVRLSLSSAPMLDLIPLCWCCPPLCQPAALQAQESAAFDGAAVVASAAYLRDRVGVPRDLKLPAARQLRAHLNWLIDALTQ